MAGFLHGIAVLSWLSGFLGAMCILVWQSLEWLRNGVLPLLPIQAALDSLEVQLPKTSWVGLQQIVDGITQWPLSLGLFVCGTVLGLIVTFFASDAERRELDRDEQARKKRRQIDLS